MMADFKKMYYDLAGAVADAVEILIRAQQRGEEDYIASDDEPVLLAVFGKEMDKDEENPQ